MSPVATPEFVRLNDRIAREGIIADVEASRWSIAGRDVLPYPDSATEPEAAEFVRRKLGIGVLEPASQSEYDAAHPAEEEGPEKVVFIEDKTPHQEAKVRAGHAERARALDEAREEQSERNLLEFDPEDVNEYPDDGTPTPFTALTEQEAKEAAAAAREEAKAEKRASGGRRRQPREDSGSES